jgi:hypothetical protein
MGLTTKVIINIALILITVIIGYILHVKGRPYNTAIFTVHKLASIAFIIFIALILISFARDNDLDALFMSMLVVAAASIIILLVSGGMMSLDKLHLQMMWVHRIFSGAFVISIAIIFYKLIYSLQHC